MKIVSVFMSNIEKINGSEPTPENSFRFFEQLKNGLKDVREFLNPADRLPTDLACFQLVGPKYVKNKIPEEIQKKSIKIDKLKRAIESFHNPPSIPERFQCPLVYDTMKIPAFDSSHPYIQRLWDKVKDGSWTASEAPIDWSLFHIMDLATIECAISENNHCPTCRHPIQEENLRINTGLQNEILHFLENQVAPHCKEVFIPCDVGIGNTLGFRSEPHWGHTVVFTWTAQGWTGYLPLDSQFKLVKTKDSNVVWEKREQNRFIPKEVKEGPLHLDGVFF